MITVYGVTHPTILLEDIQTDIPFEVTVIIPSDKAIRSKDLWRAISSKQVIQLSKSPNQIPTVTMEQELRTRIRELELENQSLREKLLQKHAELDRYSTQQTTLDAILQRLDTIPTQVVALPTFTDNRLQPVTSVVDDVPMFIPSSSIMPDIAEMRIETTKTETDTGVSDAQSKLRTMKRNK